MPPRERFQTVALTSAPWLGPSRLVGRGTAVRSFLNLARGNVANELGELDRIAGRLRRLAIIESRIVVSDAELARPGKNFRASIRECHR